MIFLIGTMKHCSVSISHFHYGAAPCPFSIAPCPFSESTFCAFFFLVKSLSKSDKNLGSYKTFCFCSAEMNLAKFMIKTSTVVDCFNPLSIVT